MAGTVPDFLRSKWKQVHCFLDANKDGLLTEDEFIAIASKMSNKGNSTPEQKARTRDNWLKWFRLLQPDPAVLVDEDRFIALHENLYLTDQKNYKEIIYETSCDMFDRIDVNGDGVISFVEFAIFYEAVGLNDIELTKHNFAKIDTNGDGKLQRQEYIDELVRHFTDPDPITGVTHFYDFPVQ